MSYKILFCELNNNPLLIKSKMFKKIIFLLVFIILITNGNCNINKSCLSSNCMCSIDKTEYLIVCSDETELKTSNMSFNQSIIIKNLKLKGLNNLKLLKYLSNNKYVEIVSLDLSNNLNDFETYLTNINNFGMLKKLNLSFNQLSIIKQRQFQKLNNLEVLDLSYNEIFYFEENAFLGLKNVLEVYLQKN